MDGGVGCIILLMYLIALNCALKMVKMVNLMCIFNSVKTLGKKSLENLEKKN